MLIGFYSRIFPFDQWLKAALAYVYIFHPLHLQLTKSFGKTNQPNQCHRPGLQKWVRNECLLCKVIGHLLGRSFNFNCTRAVTRSFACSLSHAFVAELAGKRNISGNVMRDFIYLHTSVYQPFTFAGIGKTWCMMAINSASNTWEVSGKNTGEKKWRLFFLGIEKGFSSQFVCKQYGQYGATFHADSKTAKDACGRCQVFQGCQNEPTWTRSEKHQNSTLRSVIVGFDCTCFVFFGTPGLR